MNLLQILLLALFAAFRGPAPAGAGADGVSLCALDAAVPGRRGGAGALHLAGGSGVQGSLVLNEYIFLPPVEQWSEKTLNLNNFRELFKGRPA